MVAVVQVLITMSTKEVDRLDVVKRVLERRLTRVKAAALMGLNERQVRRMCAAYEAEGAVGLVSRRRGRPSNNRTHEGLQEQAMALIRERYSDFGPTLATEKLAELHGLRISRETVRHWMKDAGLWLTRKQRVPRPHQPRDRRACLGELVQIDGSPHAWFEERAPDCSLLVYVDDATGRLMELRFAETESAFDYFTATVSYLRHHGKPVAFYSDKHSIFRVPVEGTTGINKGVTQFGRALAELNIDIVCANTAQAKGRVERMNLTLQDRLVKELRLAGISSMAEGNAFAPKFMEDFNGRFARVPRNPHDAHRPVGEQDLDQIFSWHEERTMSRNLVVHFKRVSYRAHAGDAVLRPKEGPRPRVGGRSRRDLLRRAEAPLLCPRPAPSRQPR
jgi:transposase